MGVSIRQLNELRKKIGDNHKFYIRCPHTDCNEDHEVDRIISTETKVVAQTKKIR